jgi:carbamate kinase
VSKRTAVIAFGGNALIGEKDKGTQAEQAQNAERAGRLMVEIVRRGYELIIVHGNGPQVGNILIQVEEAVTKIPPFSLDVCVAMSQGSMGYMIELALRNQLAKKNIRKPIVSLLTAVLVNKDDPAFKRPSKPIGPFYTKYRAEELARRKSWRIVEDSGRGYRRVVASPRPIRILADSSIESLVAEGNIVIAAGGGGIPVFWKDGGRLEGIDAVIDKDYTAGILATAVRADLFIILAPVPCVYLNYGTDEQRELRKVFVSEAERHLREGHFPPGSMGPKVEAVIDFVRGGGREGIITSASHLIHALQGKTGTKIVTDEPGPVQEELFEISTWS